MTELSLQEINSYLSSDELTDDYGDAWQYWKIEVGTTPVEVEGLGKVSCADEYGGQGQGDDYWVVVKVEFPDGSVRYFRKDGYYQSYSGGSLDGDMYEVFPKEKKVTVYE